MAIIPKDPQSQSVLSPPAPVTLGDIQAKQQPRPEPIRLGDIQQGPIPLQASPEADMGPYHFLNRNKIDPDAAARQIKLGRETGMPWSTVRRNEDTLRRQKQMPDMAAMYEQAPNTWQFLQNLENAAIAGPDFSELVELEKKVKKYQPLLDGSELAFIDSTAIRDAFRPWLEKVVQSWKGGVADVGSMQAGSRAMFEVFRADPDPKIEANRIAAKKRAEELPSPPSDSFMQSVGIESARQLPMMIEAFKGAQTTGIVGGALGAALGGGAAFVAGQTFPALAIFPEELITVPAAAKSGFATGYETFATAGALKEMFIFNSGEAYNEIADIVDENGDKIDPKIAAVVSGVVGAANAGLDMVGMRAIPGGKYLTGKFGKTMVEKILRMPGARTAFGKIASKYAGGITTEAFTEMVQEAVLVFGDWAAKSIQSEATGTVFAPVDTAKDIVPRILGAGQAAAFAAIGLGAIGTVVSAPIEAARINAKAMQQFTNSAQAQIYHDKIVGLSEEIAEGKIRQRSPETIAAHLGMVGAGTEVYVSPEFFQEGGIDAEKIGNAIGISTETIKKNMNLGIDTAVKLSNVLGSELEPDAVKMLARDIKPAPGAYTMREVDGMDVNADLKAISENYQKAVSENKMVAEQIRRIKKEGGVTGAGLPANYMDDFINFFTSFRYTPRKMSELLAMVNIRAAKAPDFTSPQTQRIAKASLETEEGKKWFEGSQAVTAQGSPQVYYTEKGSLQLSATKRSEASEPVFAAIKNPFRAAEITPETIQQAKDAGHDGIIAGNQAQVFSQDQVRPIIVPELTFQRSEFLPDDGLIAGFVEDTRTGTMVFNPVTAIQAIADRDKKLYQGIETPVESRGQARFMRGKAKTAGPAPQVVAEALSDNILVEDDHVASVEEALQQSAQMKYLTPLVLKKRQPTRWKEKKGLFGNEKMIFPSEAYPSGRNTYDYPGCGRMAWGLANDLDILSSCYGSFCYAERDARRYGRIIAGGTQNVQLRATHMIREVEDFYQAEIDRQIANKKGRAKAEAAALKATQKHYDFLNINLIPEERRLNRLAEKAERARIAAEEGRIYRPVETPERRLSLTITQEFIEPARVSTNLQNAEGQDIRVGVDTDGSAWLADPTVMDALYKTGLRTLSVYSSAYYAPPQPHPLSGRTIIDVTISGWHPLPETLHRLKWAEQARANGWNVILREVVANPAQFPKDAERYNRVHDALMQTDFFIMQQPLHKISKYSEPLWGFPACCIGSEKNRVSCDQCLVSEGTGRWFRDFWDINEEARPEEQYFTDLGPLLFQWDEPWYYSLDRIISDPKFPPKATGDEYLRVLEARRRKGEVKADEIAWSGLKELLQGDEKWTKDELLEFSQAVRAKFEIFDFTDRGYETEEQKRNRLAEDEDILDNARESFRSDFYAGYNGLDEWMADTNKERARYLWDNPDDFWWGYSILNEKQDYLDSYLVDGEISDDDIENAFDDFERNFLNARLSSQWMGEEAELYIYEDEAWDQFGNLYIEDAIENALQGEDITDEFSPKFEKYTIGEPKDYKEILVKFENRYTAVTAGTPAFWARMDKKYGRHVAPDELSKQDYAEYKKVSEIDESIKSFKEPHWDDEGQDVVLHMRTSIRETHDGKKILFADEIQSQLHQNGRKYGYIGDPVGPLTAIKGKNEGVYVVQFRKDIDFVVVTENIFKNFGFEPSSENAIKVAHKLIEKYPYASVQTALDKRPPRTPLANQWPLTAMKRLVFEAARQGLDGIGWTTGKQQVSLYRNQLQSRVQTLDWIKLPDNKIRLLGYAKNGSTVLDHTETRSALPDAIGVEMARKILEDEKDEGTFEGNEITVSDTGMAGFYDGRLPFDMSAFFSKKSFGRPSVDKAVIHLGGYKTLKFDVDGLIEIAEILEILGKPDDAAKVLEYSKKEELNAQEANEVNAIIENTPGISRIESIWFMPITPELKKQAENGFSLYQTDRQNPRGSFQATTAGYLLSLFENRDMSTLLHESGHLFYEEFKTLINMGIATPQQTKDWRILNEWMGVESGQPPTRDNLEKFANGLETYLWEGKAPSVELEGIFYRFRQWLRNIYQSAKVILSDDIRGVFDRMLTDQQAVENDAFQLGFEMPTKQVLDKLGVLPEDRDYLERLLKQAPEKAEQKLIKERDFKRRDNLKRWRKIAEEDLAAHPVYAFVDTVKQMGGLNRDALVDQFGEDSVRRMPAGFAVKDAMLHPDLALSIVKVIGQKGPLFSSVSRMAREIAKLPTRDEFIRAEVQQLSDEHDAQYQPIDYLLQTDEYAAFFEIIGRYTNRTQPGTATPRKAFKIFAQKELGKMDVSQAIRHDRFLASMKKHARIETDKARQGKFAEASRANEQMRLDYEMTGQAIKNRKKVEKVLSKIRTVTRKQKRGRSSSIDYQFMENIKTLALRFELAPTMPDDLQNKVELSKLVADNDGIFDNSGAFSPWLIGETYAENYKNLSMDDFNELSNLIDYLIGRGRYVKNAMLSDRKTSVDQAAKSIAALSATLPPSAYKKIYQKYGYIRKMTDLTRKFFASMDSLRSIVISIGGYRNIGAAGAKTLADELIADPLINAKDNESLMVRDLSKRLNPHLLTLHKAVIRIRKDRRYGKKISITGANATIDVLKNDGQDGWWTPEQIISMAFNQGSEGNKAQLLRGYPGLTQEMVDTLLNILDANEMGAVQGILDIINGYFPMADAVHRRVKYFPMEKVEAIEIKTAKGTWPGGYYPIAYNRHLSEKISNYSLEDDVLTRSEAVFRTPVVKSGFAQKRTPGTEYPIDLSIGVASRHLMDVIHMITHMEAIRDVDAITKRKEFRDATTKLLGKEVYEMIRPALKFIARPEQENSSRVIDYLRGFATPFFLAWNAKTAVTQSLGSIPGIFMIGPGYFARGNFEMAKSPSKTISRMREVSPFMDDRFTSYDREIFQNFKALTPGERALLFGDHAVRWDDVVNLGFLPLRIVDLAVTVPLWQGAYFKGLDETGDYEKAVKYADDVIRRTQPSAQPFDKSEALRSPGLWRMMTLFGTWSLGSYSQSQRLHWRAWTSKKLSTPDYIWFNICDNVLPFVGLEIMYAALYGQDFGDEETWLDILLGWAESTLFTGIPMLNQFFSRRGSALDSPVMLAPNEFKKAIDATRKYITSGNDQDQAKLGMAYLTLASVISRIPVSQVVSKASRGAAQTDNPSPFKFLIPAPADRR